MTYERPRAQFNDHDGIITIEGVKYSYEFFGALGFRGAPPGTALRILKRDDGVLTVEQLREIPS